MELEQIRAFCAVAETQSFTRAAEKLYVSHSTISRAVSALEDELGVRLLSRTNKVLGLTPEGEKLFSGGLGLLEAADALVSEICGRTK